MRERRNLVLLFPIVLLCLSMLNIGLTTAQPQPTYTVNPSSSTANPGETFQIEIYISGAVDMYAWEFKISWEPQLLDVVAATERPFLKSGGYSTAFAKTGTTQANLQGWMMVGCSRIGLVPGRTGSGAAANITFLVEEVYSTPLDLYESNWMDSGLNRYYNVIEVDGSFDNTGLVGTLMNAELVKKSAWPEHHHFNIPKDEDFDGTYAWNTLYGKVKNTGSLPVYLRVVFTDVPDVLTPTDHETDATINRIDPDAIVDLTLDFGPLGISEVGKVKISATANYSYGGTYWYSGPVHEKSFSFSIVWPKYSG